MEENVMFDIVENYIENEINYIKSKEDCTSLDKYEIADIYMLENMTIEDKNKLVNQILDDNELNEKLNETIHYYLYH